MSFSERFGNLLKELWQIWSPRNGDPDSLVCYVVFGLMLIIAIVSRKECGGFLKAMGIMLFALILFAILNSISTILAIVVLAICVLCFFVPRTGRILKKIILWGGIIVAIVLAVYNSFPI